MKYKVQLAQLTGYIVRATPVMWKQQMVFLCLTSKRMTFKLLACSLQCEAVCEKGGHSEMSSVMETK